MKRQLAAFLAGAALFCGVPLDAHAAQVTVFAAASLHEALKEIAAGYEKQSGDTIAFNFAGSGTLARQIEELAPADLFFSADEAKMDGLERKGLLVKGTRCSRLGNSLVVVAPPDSAAIRSPADLAEAAVHRIALGETKTVPAGTYAKAWLEKAGLWTRIEPKVVPCESVRAVLAAVESGNVEAGVVYRTDAAISKKVTVVYEVAPGEGPRISYPAALLKNAPAPAAARKFLDYLEGEAAGAVFARHGFIVLPAAGKE
jgi:molybdate transport system substrate-binding protein